MLMTIWSAQLKQKIMFARYVFFSRKQVISVNIKSK